MQTAPTAEPCLIPLLLTDTLLGAQSLAAATVLATRLAMTPRLPHLVHRRRLRKLLSAHSRIHRPQSDPGRSEGACDGTAGIAPGQRVGPVHDQSSSPSRFTAGAAGFLIPAGLVRRAEPVVRVVQARLIVPNDLLKAMGTAILTGQVASVPVRDDGEPIAVH